jgi:hypothetical protein
MRNGSPPCNGAGLSGGSGGGGGNLASSPGAGGAGNTPPVSPPQGNNGGIVGGGGGGASGAGAAAGGEGHSEARSDEIRLRFRLAVRARRSESKIKQFYLSSSELFLDCESKVRCTGTRPTSK